MGGGPPCFPQGFTCPVVLWVKSQTVPRFAYGVLTLFDRPSQTVRLQVLCLYWICPNPAIPKYYGLGSSPFARRYSGNRGFFLFLGVLRCFSSPGIPSMDYGFIHGYAGFSLRGFPHSDICGSMLACSSPQLFAACHVLHRRPVPRHSPFALSSLTFRAFLLLPCIMQFSKNRFVGVPQQ